MSEALVDRFGLSVLAGAVFRFYDDVLASRTLSPYFDDVGIKRLIEHQTQFLASVMGGPAGASDADLARIHLKLGIDGQRFEEMLALLAHHLGDLPISEDELARVVAALRSRRHLIVAEPVHAASMPAG